MFSRSAVISFTLLPLSTVKRTPPEEPADKEFPFSVTGLFRFENARTAAQEPAEDDGQPDGEDEEAE